MAVYLLLLLQSLTEKRKTKDRHGRDSRLCAWAFTAEDVRPDTYSTVLPANEKSWDETRPGPELLHCLTVNTLNFCPFGMCQVQMQSTGGLSQHPNDPDSCGEVAKLDREASGHSTSLNESIFVAVPSTQESQVDIYHLPSEQWVARIPKPSDSSAGMCFFLHLPYNNHSTDTSLISVFSFSCRNHHASPPSRAPNSRTP